jgi:hypothetical protein
VAAFTDILRRGLVDDSADQVVGKSKVEVPSTHRLLDNLLVEQFI